MPFLFFKKKIQKSFFFKQKLRCQQFGTQATDPIFAKHTALFLPRATVDLWPLQKIRHICSIFIMNMSNKYPPDPGINTQSQTLQIARATKYNWNPSLSSGGFSVNTEHHFQQCKRIPYSRAGHWRGAHMSVPASMELRLRKTIRGPVF